MVGDNSGDDDTSNISSYINGAKQIPGVIGQKATEMTPEGFKTGVREFIVRRIVRKKRSIIVLGIRKLLKDDSSIKDNDLIGFTDRYSKKAIITNYKFDFIEFISNILYYTLTQVNNRACQKCIKEFDAKKYIKPFKKELATIEFLNDEENDSLFSRANLDASTREILYIEVDGFCPTCSKSLTTNDDGTTMPIGEVIQIDPERPYETDNLLILCPDCARKYNGNITITKIEQHQAIKKALLRKQESLRIVERYSGECVKEGIKNVLRKLPKGKFDFNAKGNMKPVPVQRKLEPGNEEIIHEIKSYLNLYKQVEASCTQLTDEGVFSFELARQTIHLVYLDLKSYGLSKKEIYDQIIDYLERKTMEDRRSCTAVVSYFIRKCDIFEK